MGFIVILAVGSVVGWLASILMRDDDARSILATVLVANVGALLFSLFLSGESLLIGVSTDALLAGVAGAVIFAGGQAVTRRKVAR